MVNVFLMFDLVPAGADTEGLKAQLALEKAQWAKSGMPQQALEKTLKLSWNSKLAWLAAGGRAGTKVKYFIQTDGCHDIGGSEYTCDAPGDTASGEITLGEQTATGYKQTASVLGLLGGGLTFNPMTPSVKLTSMSWAGTSSQPDGSDVLHQTAGSVVHSPSALGSATFKRELSSKRRRRWGLYSLSFPPNAMGANRAREHGRAVRRTHSASSRQHASRPPTQRSAGNVTPPPANSR